MRKNQGEIPLWLASEEIIVHKAVTQEQHCPANSLSHSCSRNLLGQVTEHGSLGSIFDCTSSCNNSIDSTWVLHNKRRIYITTITNYTDFLFTALKTPEMITLE
jgi:hypothetical protein